MKKNEKKVGNEGVRSNLDLVTGALIAGWVCDEAAPDNRLIVAVFANGVLLGETCANIFRMDLRQAGVGDGRYGFEFPLGMSGWDEDVVFEVKIVEGNINIHGSPRALVSSSYLESMTVNKVAADSIISIHGKPLKEFSGKSLALFAIHSCKGALSPSQKRIAGSLAEHGFTVVIVDSAGVLNYRVLKDALNVAASYVLRKNFGRDFGSWVAFVQHAFDEMLEAKCALFVNDSVCGPLGDPKLLFERIKQCDYDVFALTDSWQGGYHLQSSLFSISHRGFRRRQIFEFFRDYAFPDVKEDVIAQGEIGFSKKLLSAPADVKVLARYDDVAREFLDRFENYVDLFGAFPWSSHEVGIVHDGKSVVSVTPSRGQHDYAMAWLQNLISNLVEGVPRNPQHVFWDVLIEKFNYQFIKRELLCHNPEKVATLMLFGIYASSWGQDFWEVLRYESMTMGSKTLPPLFKRGPLATVMSPPLPPALARKTKIAKK